MSRLLEFAPSLNLTGQMRRARVVEITEGAGVGVELAGTTQVVECQVLHTGAPSVALSKGDSVLVWLEDAAGSTGVLLGRTGPYTQDGSQAVVAQDEFAKRPQTLVLEAQGDVVLRNGQAKLTLGAQGDVEIVCTNYTARSQKLLRLLAPLIKLN